MVDLDLWELPKDGGMRNWYTSKGINRADKKGFGLSKRSSGREGNPYHLNQECQTQFNCGPHQHNGCPQKASCIRKIAWQVGTGSLALASCCGPIITYTPIHFLFVVTDIRYTHQPLMKRGELAKRVSLEMYHEYPYSSYFDVMSLCLCF